MTALNALPAEPSFTRAELRESPAAALREVHTGPQAQQETPFDLSVIVPTLNERGNIPLVIAALTACLRGVKWEAIFVDDDSTDGTAAYVRELAAVNPHIRCIHRIGRSGLSSACIEGMQAASAPYLAVIDADLQHDLTKLPEMLAMIRRDKLDVVVGSRYVEGGSTGTLSGSRTFISKFATAISNRFMRDELKDPMSGFFLLDRALLDRTIRNLTGRGFKILLDIFMSSDKPVRFAEVPYVMRSREVGQSKLDSLVAWEFALLIVDKVIGRYVPVRFTSFVAVGSVGAVLHLAILGAMTQVFGQAFVTGQIIASLFAMTLNFFLNNMLTYRSSRLRGAGLVWGFASFAVACSLGAAINVILARTVFEHGVAWQVAGLVGAMVGAVWNYAITSTFTWKAKARDGLAG